MRHFIVFLAVSLFCACGPKTRIITQPSTTPATPTADQATLLVASQFAWLVLNVLDGNGKVVGQLSNRSHFVTTWPAGPLKLYVMPENLANGGDRIEGTVQAGKLYYLTAGFRWGGASFTVLSQRTAPDAWKERRTYETDLPNIQMDRSRLAELEQDLGDTKPYLAQIDEVVAGFNAEEKAARTLQPDDGEGGGAK